MKSLNSKEYTLQQLTAGLDVEIKGNPLTLITGVCNLHQANADQITFLTSPAYKKYLESTTAGAVILSPDDAISCPVNAVITRNPYYVYAKIAAFFEQRSKPKAGVHPSAAVAEDCQIDPTASVGANCVIEKGVKLGARVVIGSGSVVGEYTEIDEDTMIEANTTIAHRCILGKRVVIASGTVIGSDGFGNARNKGQWHRVPQLGRVIIEDDVEIGSNCSIDRGAIDDTVIEKGVRLDNLIQVAHNVRIGQNTAIAGCTGIAGSAVIGKNCIIGGSAGVNGHITIADNVVITGMTAVTKSIREPGMYSSGVGGLTTNLEWRKNSARFHRLDQLTQRVKQLESALEDLLAERKAT